MFYAIQLQMYSKRMEERGGKHGDEENNVFII